MTQISTTSKGGKIQDSFMAGARDRLNTQMITALFLNAKQKQHGNLKSHAGAPLCCLIHFSFNGTVQHAYTG
jgi:hypothetical protein